MATKRPGRPDGGAPPPVSTPETLPGPDGNIVGRTVGLNARAVSAIIAEDVAEFEATFGDVLDEKGEPELPDDVGGATGAARVPGGTVAEDMLKQAMGLDSLPVNPLLRVSTSPSAATRRVAQKLFETPFRYSENRFGIRNDVSIEICAKMWASNRSQALEEMDRLFVEHLETHSRPALAAAADDEAPGSLPDIDPDAAANTPPPRRGDLPPTGRLTPQGFKDAVGRAIRTGEVHLVPQVMAAVRVFRAMLFDPLMAIAVEHGLLPDEVPEEGALAYMTRVYELEKIVADRDEFEDRITVWLTNRQNTAEARIDALKNKAEAVVRDIDSLRRQEVSDDSDTDGDVSRVRRSRNGRSTTGPDEAARLRDRLAEIKMAIEDEMALLGAAPEALEIIAREITGSILSSPAGRVPYEPVRLARGPLVQRIFDIPDAAIEDFLETDAELLARFFTRTFAPDAELARAFGRADMREQVDNINDDFAFAIALAGTEAERKALDDRRKADIRDISAMRDRLRGTFAAPSDPNALLSRGAPVVRHVDFLRVMGDMTGSAIPVVARPAMADGLFRVFGPALTPTIAKVRALRLDAGEAALLATAARMAVETRALALTDLGDDFGRQVRFQRNQTLETRPFAMSSAMSPWNAAFKQAAGVVAQTRILDISCRWAAGRIGKADRDRLRDVGVTSRNMARRFATQFNRHGRRDGPALLAGISHWDDDGAARAFREAVRRDTDRMIVPPGLGDAPLFMSEAGWELLAEFRSFALAATQRMLAAALRQRESAVLNGLTLATTLGMLSFATYALSAGRRLGDDPEVWLTEGIDRSGVVGFLYDIANILERVSDGTIGVNALVGGPAIGDITARDIAGAAFGPTIALFDDAARIAGASGMARGLGKPAARAIRRILPYQNMFYLRGLFAHVEGGIAEEGLAVGGPIGGLDSRDGTTGVGIADDRARGGP